MRGELHARFYERPVVKLRRPTQPFRARRSKDRWGKFFVNFSSGVSNSATKVIRQEIRCWQLRCRVDKWIDDLARMFNLIIRGWINYYGRYYKSALYPTLRHLDRRLAHWAMAKYKRLRRHRRRAEHWIHKVALRDPALFAHWPLLHRATTGTVRAGSAETFMSGAVSAWGRDSPGRPDSECGCQTS